MYIEALGLNPDEVLSKEALAKPQRTVVDSERRQIQSLLLELNEILENAPSTDEKAYSKARDALKIPGEMTFSSKEIDSFLPEDLRMEK